ALAVIEGALAPAHAPEVEAQDREAALHEVIIQVVDDLVVHRPAELRVRKEDDGDGSAFFLGRLIPPLDATGGTREGDFRHIREPLAHLSIREGNLCATLTPGLGFP